MALAAGTRLTSYEIGDLLGAGGMGEVYRARDTRLGRSVAIKVLPEAFEFEADRVARFEREAKVLASLNHPHIAALYGMEEAGGRHFLVMELVEGQTLAERIARGPISIEDALGIAHQIAEALEAAHERGVVHRDLKPANLKITPEDKLKVLDFGLARAMASESTTGAPNATHSPTLSMMATQAGMILGTAAYMSPEQAKGFPADHRSDVFSFGSVLYEMLTGRQPFHGDTAAEILASVLVREPDLAALPANLNPRVAELLRRCFEKNPKKRWQAAGDLRVELETIATSPRALPSAQTAAAATPLWIRATPAVLAAVLAGGITAAAMWLARPVAPAPVVERFAFGLPDGQEFSGQGRTFVAISPDGRQIAYGANGRLYVRSMSELQPRVLIGTDLNPNSLTFSPDGGSIAFVSGVIGTFSRTISRISVNGGTPVTVCQVSANTLGLSWTADSIVFGLAGAGVMRVSASGGMPEQVIRIDGTDLAYGPQLLPDGEHVLFTLATGATTTLWDKAKVVVESLKSHTRQVLVDGGSDGRYLSSGHVVYAIEGVLYALPFDASAVRALGAPTAVVEGIGRSLGGASGAAQFGVSTNGSLIYVPGPKLVSSASMTVALVDNGATTALNIPPGAYEFPRVSPDGKRLAVGTDDGNDANIWIYDLSGATSIRRLTNGGKNRFPIWSADSLRVVFQSDREGDRGIFWQMADGAVAAERLTKADKDVAHIPESSNSTHVLFVETKGSTNLLKVLSLQDRKAEGFGGVQSELLPAASFSPDGRWVAYTTAPRANLTGVNLITVTVQPFPANGSLYPISQGIHPFWSPDGKALFYRQRGQSVGVSVTTQPTFAFGNPTPVNVGQLRERGPQFERENDITHDGKQFVVVVSEGASSVGRGTPQIHVVLNWFEELKQRVPAR